MPLAYYNAQEYLNDHVLFEVNINAKQLCRLYLTPVYIIGFVMRVKRAKKKRDFISIAIGMARKHSSVGHRDESVVICPEIIGMGPNRMRLHNMG